MNHLGDTNKMVGEDHIRDATKMVSETLRTDGLLTAILDSDGFVHNGNCPQRWVNYARELERELNAANDRIKRMEEFVEQLTNPKFTRDDLPKEALLQRIKRLEEALEGTVKWIVHLADSGDAGFWDVEKQSEIIAARAALKKESKP